MGNSGLFDHIAVGKRQILFLQKLSGIGQLVISVQFPYHIVVVISVNGQDAYNGHIREKLCKLFNITAGLYSIGFHCFIAGIIVGAVCHADEIAAGIGAGDQLSGTEHLAADALVIHLGIQHSGKTADIGVAGKDILLEYSPDVYELADLNVGKCRMAVAAKRDADRSIDRALKEQNK